MGGASGYMPMRAARSAKLMPAAFTRTRTCPSPASGSGASRTCSTSGAPALLIQICRIGRYYPNSRYDRRMVRRRATYDDLLKLPEHLVGEIIDGELIVSPRPANPHALAGSLLGHDLLGGIYARVGIPNAWLLNPLARTLEVLTLHDGKWVLTSTQAGDDRARRSLRCRRARAFALVDRNLS